MQIFHVLFLSVCIPKNIFLFYRVKLIRKTMTKKNGENYKKKKNEINTFINLKVIRVKIYNYWGAGYFVPSGSRDSNWYGTRA